MTRSPLFFLFSSLLFITQTAYSADFALQDPEILEYLRSIWKKKPTETKEASTQTDPEPVHRKITVTKSTFTQSSPQQTRKKPKPKPKPKRSYLAQAKSAPNHKKLTAERPPRRGTRSAQESKRKQKKATNKK